MAFFPVDCSILSSVALAEQIVPQYLAPPIGCQLLRHGDNNTYLVEQNGQLSILRVWSHTKHFAAALEAELKLLEHLALTVFPSLRRSNGVMARIFPSSPHPKANAGLRCFNMPLAHRPARILPQPKVLVTVGLWRTCTKRLIASQCHIHAPN